MEHQSFYRAYRPQTFSDMSGQQMIKRTLQNALTNDRTTHAYLFSGPRGTGKTTTAKVFAKALNCENGPASEPCNTCPTCLSIMEGSNTDVIEFDAASNSRVEEIREVIEKVRFAPASSTYKVYIIDEVHMLSNSAFNALLKTLEEPPAHAIFILATTEPHKIPATIISRCQRFDFKPLTRDEIIDRLQTVLTDVGVEASPSALSIIAQSAAGGMRDALSALDQVVSFSEGAISEEDALLVTGVVSEQSFFALTEAMVEQDAVRAISLLDELIAEGKDELRLVEDLITFFRDLLLLQRSQQATHLLHFITQPSQFEDFSEQVPAQLIYQMIDIFAKAQQDMRFSNHARVYIESAILKVMHAVSEGRQANVALPEQVEQELNSLKQLVQQLQQNTQVANQNHPVPTQQRQVVKKAAGTYQAPKGRVEMVLKEATREHLNQLRMNWAAIKQDMTKSHAALLDKTEPVAASEHAFLLKFEYDIHCTMALEKEMLKQEMLTAIQNRLQLSMDVIYIPEEQWVDLRAQFIKNAQQIRESSDEEEMQTDAPVQTQAPVEQPFDESGDAVARGAHVEEAEKLFGEIVTVIDE